jgi:hypothetical protein
MNNPLLFNAAFCGISGGCDADRWIINGADLNLNQAVRAAATTIDSFIPPIVGGATSSQAALLQSICEGIYTSRYLQDANPLSYTVIAQSIANNFNAAQLNLVPTVSPIPAHTLTVQQVPFTFASGTLVIGAVAIGTIIALAQISITTPFPPGSNIQFGTTGNPTMFLNLDSADAGHNNSYNELEVVTINLNDLLILTTNTTGPIGSGTLYYEVQT